MRHTLLTLTVSCLTLNTGCMLSSPELEDEMPTEQTPEPAEPTATLEPVVDVTPFPEPTPFDYGVQGEAVAFDAAATIQTIAGSGDAGTGYSVDFSGYPLCSNTGSWGGDGGAATDAQLNWPTGLAVDGLGNVLVADQCNSVIRSISPSGLITTTAPAALYAYEGDRVSYGFFGPGGIEVSASGNRYVVDTFSHVIFKRDVFGLNRAVAGTPWETGLTGYGEGGHPALDTELYYPTGMAEDSAGRLYIANYGMSEIIMVDEEGIAHTLEIQVADAGGLAIDAQDNLYVTDNSNHRILKRTPAGVVTVLAGASGDHGFAGDGGPATLAHLNWPSGVRVRDDGLVFFTDTNNQRVRVIDTDGKIYTVAGNGARLEGSTWGDIGMFGGDGGPAAAASLNQPYALDFDAEGNLYIADAMNNRIRKVTFSSKGALRK